MYAYLDTVPGCCGIGTLYEFNDNQYGKPLDSRLPKLGSGMFIATFNGSPISNEAEEELKANHQLLWESPAYINKSQYAEDFGRENGVRIAVFLNKAAEPELAQN